jgi:hypothetical protein
MSEEKLAIFFGSSHQFENDRFTDVVKGYLNRDPDSDEENDEENSITLINIINKCRVETTTVKLIAARTLDMKLHNQNHLSFLDYAEQSETLRNMKGVTSREVRMIMSRGIKGWRLWMAIYLCAKFQWVLQPVIDWLEAINNETKQMCDGNLLQVSLDRMFFDFCRLIKSQHKARNFTEPNAAANAIEAMGVTFLETICSVDQFPHSIFYRLGGVWEMVESASNFSFRGTSNIQPPLPPLPSSSTTLAITNSAAGTSGPPATPSYTHTSQQLVSTQDGVILNNIICVFLLAEKLEMKRKGDNTSNVSCTYQGGKCLNPHVELNTITAEQAAQAVKISTAVSSHLQGLLTMAITANSHLFK